MFSSATRKPSVTSQLSVADVEKLSAARGLLRVTEPASDLRSDRPLDDSKDPDSKEAQVSAKRNDRLISRFQACELDRALVKPRICSIGKAFANSQGLRMTLKLYSPGGRSDGAVVVNSAAAKFLQFLSSGSGSLKWGTIIPAIVEFTDADALFSQFFVHRVVVHYVPVNSGSSNSSANGATATAAGQPGFVNTLMGVIAFLPNNTAVYLDAQGAFVNMCSQPQHKIVNLAESFSFEGRNLEKFSWDGPLGDQASGSSSCGWLNIANAAVALGGFFQLATPESSGAAAGIGTLVEGGILGHCVFECDISFRARQ